MGQSFSPRHFCIATIIATLLTASAVLAQTGAGLTLRRFAPDRQGEVAASTLFMAETDADELPDDPQLSLFESAGRFRLPSMGPADLRLGYDVFYMNTDVQDDLLPEQLTDQSIALGVLGRNRQGWNPGFTLGGGYAGDTPYRDGSAWYAKSSLSAMRDLGHRSSLAVSLEYDGNRAIFPDVPLPGVAYTFWPQEELSLTLGFPRNRVVWKPTSAWTLEASSLLWFDADARVAWEFAPTWQLFADLRSLTRAFHLEELDGEDRLFFRQRRAETGVAWSPKESVTLTLAAGYAFSQEFSSGFDTRNDDTLSDLDDAPYLRAAVQVGF